MSTNSLASADSSHYFFDLLFSPKAAFVWDGVREAIVWMNKSARAKFGKEAEALCEALSKPSLRQLKALCDWAAKPDIPHRLKITLKGAAPFVCKPTPLQLADGHAGLIIAELDEEVAVRAPIFSFTTFIPPSALKKRPLKRLKPAKAVAPSLTEDELRSFEALGRKVRQLSKTKRQTVKAAPKPVKKPSLALASVAKSPVPEKGSLPAKQAAKSASRQDDAPLLQALLPAFDAFLKLDETFAVVGVEGRLQKLGWRKADVLKQPLGALFPKSEQANLKRTLQKLKSGRTKSTRIDAKGQARAGLAWRSRITFGHWPRQEASYYAAFILMDQPELNRANTVFIKPAQTKKLAA